MNIISYIRAIDGLTVSLDGIISEPEKDSRARDIENIAECLNIVRPSVYRLIDVDRHIKLYRRRNYTRSHLHSPFSPGLENRFIVTEVRHEVQQAMR